MNKTPFVPRKPFAEARPEENGCYEREAFWGDVANQCLELVAFDIIGIIAVKFFFDYVIDKFGCP